MIILENENKTPIAFMEIEDTKLEMLFIKNSEKLDEIIEWIEEYDSRISKNRRFRGYS